MPPSGPQSPHFHNHTLCPTPRDKLPENRGLQKVCHLQFPRNEERQGHQATLVHASKPARAARAWCTWCYDSSLPKSPPLNRGKLQYTYGMKPRVPIDQVVLGRLSSTINCALREEGPCPTTRRGPAKKTLSSPPNWNLAKRPTLSWDQCK